jgi:hypothetical protein
MYENTTPDSPLAQGVGSRYLFDPAGIFQLLVPASLPEPASVAIEKPCRVKTKVGRPSATEWYQRPRTRIDGRVWKRSFVIPNGLFMELTATDSHARTLGRPFTHVLTIKPKIMDAMAPELRLPFWRDLIDNIGRQFRREGMPWTYTLSRESNKERRDGTGEHIHLLGHFPLRILKIVMRGLNKRFPGAEEVDCLTIKRASFRLRNGKYGSPLLYALKNFSPYLAAKSTMQCKRGGAILGRRAFCSRDLTPKAMAEWRAEHRI